MMMSTTRRLAVLALCSTLHHPSQALSLPNVKELTSVAISYASANGLQVEQRKTDDNDNLVSYECAPISLLPNAYPKSCFEKAQSLAEPFNLLVDRISRDGDFLVETLRNVNDPFTQKLLSLYQEIYMSDDDSDDAKKNIFAKQADRLGIQRSDYMLNAVEGGGEMQMKQVELNTVAASFAGLATKVAALHQHLVKRFNVKEYMEHNIEAIGGGEVGGGGVPDNPALKALPNAMALAFERYTSKSNNNNKCVLLMVVQEGETNTVDQRMLEFQLWEEHGIHVVRKSLTALYDELETNNDGALTLGNGDEVAVVYFRAGYAPTDYPSDKEWEARKQLELGRATKCPNLGYHLAGTKKVQQALARPGTLERFFCDDDDKNIVDKMKSAFAGLYSLGDDAVEEDLSAVQQAALEGGEGRYVLKPQREGGGYNFYGDELKKKLSANINLNDKVVVSFQPALSEFILMERLFPPQQNAVLLRSGQVEGEGKSISEFGCFGTILTDQDAKVVHNEYSGFLLRTKFENVDEGGVASGFATLSSPFLC